MICVFNAKLIDNVSPASYLACLLLKKSDRRSCCDGETDVFSNHGEYDVLKIVRQDHSFSSEDALKACSDVLIDDGIVPVMSDFRGDYVFPSFIDFHCHSEFLYLKEPGSEIRRDDLISDEIVGNCGVSVYPVAGDDSRRRDLKENVLSILGDWPENLPQWNSFRQFKDIADSLHISNNLMFLQGHSALRIAAMEGNPNRKADSREIARMRKMLDDSLSEGAIGFSTGLYYAPCVFADDKEILALLEVVREHDALFAIHRREEGNDGLNATAEAISYAGKAKVRLQISHLKAIGDSNQNQVGGILDMIEKAHSDGIDIAFDQYPYEYGSTSLASLLPPRVLQDGERTYKRRLIEDRAYREEAKRLMMNPSGFESIAQLVSHDKIFIQYSDAFDDLIGKSIEQIASMWNVETLDVILDIVARETGICTMRDVTQSEENLIRIMSHPLSIFGTDALFAGKLWHDRSRNASRHMLRRYSDAVGIENLVRRSTSQSADRLGLKDRRIVKEGVKVRLVRFGL